MQIPAILRSLRSSLAMIGVDAGVISFLLYIGALLAMFSYLLRLNSRFVKLHERIASAMEDAARSLHRGDQ